MQEQSSERTAAAFEDRMTRTYNKYLQDLAEDFRREDQEKALQAEKEFSPAEDTQHSIGRD